MTTANEGRHFVVVGGGQAGAEVAGTLRKQGFTGRVTLLTEEAEAPYRRPPLSKTYFTGEAERASLSVMKPEQLQKADIDCRTGVAVTAIDRDAKQLTLSDGTSLGYDRLALALGGRARPLRCDGAELDNVFLLRTVADVDAIRAQCREGARMCIVGGGFIGLEVAASARKLGLQVTVLEAEDRVLARVTAPVVSQFFEARHRAEGVDLRTGVAVEALEGDGRVKAVRLADGSRIEADIVIVGIGLIPNCEVAEAAGLKVDNGIVVDERTATSDPDIFAAGDCANHPNRFAGGHARLESVQNAMEQARVAAAAMLDQDVRYDAVPWFWSDQYDLKLQMAGLSHGYDETVVRGSPETDEKFSVFYLRGGVLIACDAVGRPQDFMFAKKLVTEGVRPDKAKLADPDVALKDLMPAAA